MWRRGGEVRWRAASRAREERGVDVAGAGGMTSPLVLVVAASREGWREKTI